MANRLSRERERRSDRFSAESISGQEAIILRLKLESSTRKSPAPDAREYRNAARYSKGSASWRRMALISGWPKARLSGIACFPAATLRLECSVRCRAAWLSLRKAFPYGLSSTKRRSGCSAWRQSCVRAYPSGSPWTAPTRMSRETGDPDGERERIKPHYRFLRLSSVKSTGCNSLKWEM